MYKKNERVPTIDPWGTPQVLRSKCHVLQMQMCHCQLDLCRTISEPFQTFQSIFLSWSNFSYLQYQMHLMHCKVHMKNDWWFDMIWFDSSAIQLELTVQYSHNILNKIWLKKYGCCSNMILQPANETRAGRHKTGGVSNDAELTHVGVKLIVVYDV